ncbi:putative leucine-rich repeat domain superfamily [Helianthus anomalus]
MTKLCVGCRLDRIDSSGSFLCTYNRCRNHPSSEYAMHFKNLQSLEICGGGLTDVGVANITDLRSLMLLNLSLNHCLTDASLELIAGIFI